jgi:hypothetical protein
MSNIIFLKLTTVKRLFVLEYSDDNDNDDDHYYVNLQVLYMIICITQQNNSCLFYFRNKEFYTK